MPVNSAVLCRNFIQLHDAFKSHGDSLEKLIEQLIADLKTVLQGPFLTEFSDNMDKATTTAERISVLRKTGARIEKLLQSIVGTPLVDWPAKALELLTHLWRLLEALEAVRKQETAMGEHVAVWCE